MPSSKSKSALAEALDAVAVSRDAKCKVGKWVDSLNDEDRAHLELRLSTLAKGTVYGAVGKFVNCSATTWNAHFGKRCACQNGAVDA